MTILVVSWFHILILFNVFINISHETYVEKTCSVKLLYAEKKNVIVIFEIFMIFLFPVLEPQ